MVHVFTTIMTTKMRGKGDRGWEKGKGGRM
jgi:hypothetical protein